MVLDHAREHPSRRAAVTSIAAKIGCTPQTLYDWVEKAEINSGQRAAVPTEMAKKLKALERENGELRALPKRRLASSHILPRLNRQKGNYGLRCSAGYNSTYMPLKFRRATEKLEIWSASSNGFSFVITHEQPSGPGFRGLPGYLASWRPLYLGNHAIKIIGSPFKTFEDAEAACKAMLNVLTLARTTD